MFLKPHKHTKINQSLLCVSADIIKVLLTKKDISFSEMQKLIIEKRWQSVRDNFLLALCLLYSLQKVEYIKETDSVILSIN